jgi:hypothetical protein
VKKINKEQNIQFNIRGGLAGGAPIERKDHEISQKCLSLQYLVVVVEE